MYVAPELNTGKVVAYSQKVDIYSLGRHLPEFLR